MKDRRFGLLLALLGGCNCLCGCSSTFQLFVGNDTERAFALRIDQSSHAYPLKPATKRKLPVNSTRRFILHIDGQDILAFPKEMGAVEFGRTAEGTWQKQ